MQNLEKVCEQIRDEFNAKTEVREQALKNARELIRRASLAIRAIHRDDLDVAEQELQAGQAIVDSIITTLKPEHPDLYFTGYTQDALKEFCEAKLTAAILNDKPLPSPAELRVELPAWLNGLTETLGEIRRRCLDILRTGYTDEVERLLSNMDEIFTQLVTMDYPDAITEGLRRRTDLARGIIERTRADITTSYRQQKLTEKLDEFYDTLSTHMLNHKKA